MKRDLISIEIKVYIAQYVGTQTHCPKFNKNYTPEFPSNVKSIINYNEDIKSLITYLNTYCNIPNEKITEFLKSISNNKINISNGTIVNTLKQFNKKSGKIMSAEYR